ncbi:MAG: cytochrome b562 [Tepidisphaeraceae bacterium]
MSTRPSLVRSIVALSAVAALAAIPVTRALADEHEGHPTTGPAHHAPTTAPAHAVANDHEALEHAMEAMEKSIKLVATQIDDASKDAATLEALAKFEFATLQAKGALPGTINRKPEAERAEATTDYRKMMGQVLVTALEIEQNLLDGKRDEAKKGLGELKDIQKLGHDEFRPKKQPRK